MFWKYFILLILLAANAGAQKFEIGGLGGAGTFGAEDVSGTYWVAGAEGCFFCNKKAALFVEYNHYGLSSGRTPISSADMFSGGLRLQRAEGRLRPYFDVGVTGGQDHFMRDSHNLVGVALGGGVSISLGKHWYVRPGVHLQFTNWFHYGLWGGASVGYRF
jgi:hypothetical protein